MTKKKLSDSPKFEQKTIASIIMTELKNN